MLSASVLRASSLYPRLGELLSFSFSEREKDNHSSSFCSLLNNPTRFSKAPDSYRFFSLIRPAQAGKFPIVKN
jgi:hypothetical protein